MFILDLSIKRAKRIMQPSWTAEIVVLFNISEKQEKFISEPGSDLERGFSWVLLLSSSPPAPSRPRTTFPPRARWS